MDKKPKQNHVPWEVEKHSDEDIRIVGKNVTIAENFTEEDAAFIVRAVNAHEYLLKSAKLSYELFNELRRTMDEGHWFADDLTKIGEALSQAIAKAEGK